MTFTLNIKLGNDAMQTGNDVASALVEVARKVRATIGTSEISGQDAGRIHDLNGNTVGQWEVK